MLAARAPVRLRTSAADRLSGTGIRFCVWRGRAAGSYADRMTESPSESHAHPRDANVPRWAWIVLAAIAGIAVLFVTGFTQGACYDSSDPAKSYCESGPIVGVAGVWIAWIAYGVFATFCVVKTVRARPTLSHGASLADP